MPSSGSWKASAFTLIAALVLVAALLYKRQRDEANRAKLDETLSSLLRVEKSFTVNQEARVAIGYGSCVDVVSSAADVITSHFDPPTELRHFDVISSEDQLLQSFAFFYVRGAAAE